MPPNTKGTRYCPISWAQTGSPGQARREARCQGIAPATQRTRTPDLRIRRPGACCRRRRRLLPEVARTTAQLAPGQRQKSPRSNGSISGSFGISLELRVVLLACPLHVPLLLFGKLYEQESNLAYCLAYCRKFGAHFGSCEERPSQQHNFSTNIDRSRVTPGAV